MATWESILNMAKDAVETAEKKTGEFIDVTKLKMDINRIEKELAATYEALGRLVYDAKKGSDDIGDLMDACVMQIDELSAELEKLQNKLAESRNVLRCPACGCLNDQDAAFCKCCGEKI